MAETPSTGSSPAGHAQSTTAHASPAEGSYLPGLNEKCDHCMSREAVYRVLDYRERENWVSCEECIHYDLVSVVDALGRPYDEGSKPEMTDREFARRFKLWARVNPREFDQWIKQYARIHGGFRITL